jgi:uncharacterized protein YjbJ (UPF0337 family)
MKINENSVKGKWLEIKGEIQRAWGKLTDNELETSKGDIKAISGLIQQRYGKAQDQHDKKLSSIFERFEAKKDKAVKKVKKKIKH